MLIGRSIQNCIMPMKLRYLFNQIILDPNYEL